MRALIYHEDAGLVVYATPERHGSVLAQLLEDFDPEPCREPIEGELEPHTLGAVLPRGFLRLVEWVCP